LKEEQGVVEEAHVEDTEEGTLLRRTWRTQRRVFDREMTGLGFRGSGTLKQTNSSDGHDDIINTHRYI
jgi:hypothetical protein